MQLDQNGSDLAFAGGQDPFPAGTGDSRRKKTVWVFRAGIQSWLLNRGGSLKMFFLFYFNSSSFFFFHFICLRMRFLPYRTTLARPLTALGCLHSSASFTAQADFAVGEPTCDSYCWSFPWKTTHAPQVHLIHILKHILKLFFWLTPPGSHKAWLRLPVSCMG